MMLAKLLVILAAMVMCALATPTFGNIGHGGFGPGPHNQYPHGGGGGYNNYGPHGGRGGHGSHHGGHGGHGGRGHYGK